MVKDIIRSETFVKQLKKIDKSVLVRVEKLVIKIIQNPEIGKPMRYGRKGTREVHASSLRLSYAYDGDNDVLYFLDLYHKDEQ